VAHTNYTSLRVKEHSRTWPAIRAASCIEALFDIEEGFSIFANGGIMTVIHRSRIIAFILVLLAGLTLHGGIAAQSDGTGGATPNAFPAAAAGGAEEAVAWLIAQQGDEGGFIGFSGEPDAGTTVDALFALVAAQQIGIDTSASIEAAVAYLESSDTALVYTQTGVGQAAKLVLALHALGLDPHNIANVDPLAILGSGQSPDTGLYGTGVYDHAMAILALAASGEEIPAGAVTSLQDFQADNGGWAFDGSTDDAAADSNTTAIVIQALAASGLPDEGMIEAGLEYLQSTLHDGKGAAYNSDPASLPDSNSTALVAQAVIATGGNPATQDWQDLVTALFGFQNADGSFGYQDGAMEPNLLSTVQAIPALANLAFPIEPASEVSATPVGSVPGSWLAAA
jgi:hypothetical protein